MDTNIELRDRLLVFAADVFDLVAQLETTPVGRSVGNQLRRSAVSAGGHWTNTGIEDDDHLRSIQQNVMNNLQESLYWLKFIRKSHNLPALNKQIETLSEEAEELANLVSKSLPSIDKVTPEESLMV